MQNCSLSMNLQPLYGVLLKAQSTFLCFLLVTMIFYAKVLLNFFFWKCVLFGGEWVEVKSLHVRWRPQMLDCMTLSGAGKMQHSSACTEMGQGTCWTLSFDSLEELTFRRFKLVSKECREFTSSTNRCIPFHGWRKQCNWVPWPFEKSRVCGSPWQIIWCQDFSFLRLGIID